MTDAHCHVSCGDPAVRELLVGRDFFGVHPWETLGEISGKDEVGLTNGKGKAGVTSGKGELTLSDPKPTLSDPKPTLSDPTSTLNDPILTLSGPISTLSDPIPTLVDPTPTLIDPNLQEHLLALRAKLLANPTAGVGEIGLDRLKCRDISPRMREVFETQLALAIELKRPVVLHGAKCWGQVVAAVKVQSACAAKPLVQGADAKHPAPSTSAAGAKAPGTRFLFHGFSRSDGLIPDIVKLNGYISVGPAVLNDHAVNYRELVKKIPLDRFLVETDRTEANAADCPSVRDVLAKVAELRGVSAAELEKITDENVEKFFGASL